METKAEKKLLTVDEAEFKFDADSGVISGYASVFNGVDSYGDTIAPGAYTRTLKNRQRSVKMRWNHFGPVIGKWTDIHENSRGLFVKGELTPGHSVAKDVLASLKHGAIDGLSIGFYARDYEDTEKGRLLKDIELVEISVVEEPADLAARITQIKSVIEKADLKEIEGILRDAGFSRDAATALVSRMKSLIHGEREAKDRATEIVAILQSVNLPE